MDELLKALKLLLAHGNRDEVVGLIEKEGPALFQPIFQRGHDIGYGKKHGELEKATARIATLETELSTAQGEVTKLKANPDTQALHAQYGGEISTLRTAAQKREQELLEELRTERENLRVGDLYAMLTSGDKRLQSDYAKVLTERRDVRQRIKINPDRTWQVLQQGKDIPIAAQTPEAALALLAEELKAAAPAGLVIVGTDKGGGMPGSRTSETPAPTGGAALADSIRASVKAAVAVAPEAPKPHGAFAPLADD